MIIVQLLHMLLLLHPHHLLNHHHQYLRLNTKNSVMSTAKKQKMNNDNNCDDGSSSLKRIKAGFIGCGTIASAIATSLATPDHKTHLSKAGYTLQSISVTRRSESKSSKLKENFEDVLTVYESAEEVVSNSNLIFCTLSPSTAPSNKPNAVPYIGQPNQNIIMLLSPQRVGELSRSTPALFKSTRAGMPA